MGRITGRGTRKHDCDFNAFIDDRFQMSSWRSPGEPSFHNSALTCHPWPVSPNGLGIARDILFWKIVARRLLCASFFFSQRLVKANVGLTANED